MTRTERVIATLLLVVAVAGGALIPRLLSVPALSLGVPRWLGPSDVGVQVQAIPRARRQATHPHGPPPPVKVAAASAAPVAPVAAQPAPSAVPASKPPQNRPPSPPSPPLASVASVATTAATTAAAAGLSASSDG